MGLEGHIWLVTIPLTNKTTAFYTSQEELHIPFQYVEISVVVAYCLPTMQLETQY